jgi:hypothetical protein
MNREPLTELSEIVWRQLFIRFPEWQECAEIVESEASDDYKSVYVRIRAPADGESYLFEHKPLPPQFIASNELEGKRKRLVRIRSWKGIYNWE